jgi:hypothetical protein
MLEVRKFMSGAILFGLALGLILIPQQAASKSPQEASAPQSSANEAVPAFHAQPPVGELPATMDPALFADPFVQNAYAAAAKIKKTLYQQPCYCHCDRSHGHTSLLDCFASKHGSGCGTCKKAGAPRRFAPASSRASGRPSTSPSIRSRCPPIDADRPAFALPDVTQKLLVTARCNS